MEQISFIERVDTGRAIGHDLYCHGRGPLREAWPAPVHEGYAAARARGAGRRAPDRYVRKWLQLRLSAFERGRVINADVTPDLLRLIDVDVCPVTRVPLTHGALTDSDWSVDRLNNEGAYAANNLAVMSVAANRAKGALAYDAVYERALRATSTDGLQPVEWLRLAALMLGPCFATRPAEAPAIPLAAPMPNRTLRPAVQQIQHVMTGMARRQAGKNALIKHFKGAASSPCALMRLRTCCEALHQAMKRVDDDHDAWLAPGVMDAFVAWREALDGQAWALAGEIARQLAGSRIVPAGRLASWHLAQGGYLA